MKKILLVCGVHGDEQNSVKMCNHVAKEYDNVEVAVLEESKGAREKNTRCDGDGIDWNRNASKVESINFKSYSAIIDVHCSPNLLQCAVIDNDIYAKDYLLFCESNGIPYAIVDVKDTIKNRAKREGVPGFTVELDGMGLVGRNTWHDNFLFLKQFIDKVNEVGDLKREFIDKPRGCVSFTDMMVDVKMNFDVLDKEKLVLGTFPGFYKKGDTIMYFRSGEKIVAPCDGWVIDYDECPYAYIGKSLFEFQKKICKVWKC